MNCPHCSAENPTGARMCRQCGAEFELPDPLLGQEVLGRYRVVSLIGEGGMGRVYLAEQRVGTTIRKVAVKTLRPQLSADKQLARRFFREAETIVRLTHPNTIQFFDFGELPDGTLIIVMEYIQGRSLAQELGRGPLPTDRADRIFAQVCGALAEAHGLGIVHRDLKPDNILLTERGGQRDFVKVLDFGIAKISVAEDDKTTKLTQQGMMVGTPPYMSPEQFSAETIDARSDIYSLGIIAYEMLTGKLPFMAHTPWEWASKHLTAEPEALEINEASGISVRRVQAIRKALNKSRDRRHQDVTELMNDFTGAGALAFTATMVQPPLASTPAPPLHTPVHASTPGPQVAATPESMSARPASGASVPRVPTPGPVVAAPVSRQTPAPSDDEPPPILPTRAPVLLWLGGAVAVAAVAVLGTVFVLGSGGRQATPPAPPPPAATASLNPPLPSQPAVAPPPRQGEAIPTLKAVEPSRETPSVDPSPAETSKSERRKHGERHEPHGTRTDDRPPPAESDRQASPLRTAPTPAPAVTTPPVTPAPSPTTQAPEDKAPVRVLVPVDLQERIAKATAMAKENVGGAVGLYQAAVRKYGEDAPGMKGLKATIAREGESHLRTLIAASRCAQAQAFYRALTGIGAAPASDKLFGKTCAAP